MTLWYHAKQEAMLENVDYLLMRRIERARGSVPNPSERAKYSIRKVTRRYQLSMSMFSGGYCKS